VVADPNGAWARPEVNGGRNVDHVALAVQTLNAGDVREHLDARGVTIDPSGNTIELIATR
jgi:hypothetical protein